MHRIIILAIIYFLMNISYGQNQKKDSINANMLNSSNKKENKNDLPNNIKIYNNNVFVELIGNARVLNPYINYERVLLSHKNFYLTGRIGFTFVFFKDNDEISYSLPLLLNGIYKLRNRLFIELGAGITEMFDRTISYYNDIDNSYYLCGTLLAGIRIQRKDGLFFRFGFTPVFELTKIRSFWPIAGISFGYSFEKRK